MTTQTYFKMTKCYLKLCSECHSTSYDAITSHMVIVAIRYMMDMLGFLRLRAWDATREQEKKKPRQRFIDEVWPGVKPG